MLTRQGTEGQPHPCPWLPLASQKARILRSKSLCHDEIENILDSDHRELIGDYSKVPAVGPSGGSGLYYVAPEPSDCFSDSHSPRSPSFCPLHLIL